jgi:hypothetical protein
MRAWAPSRFRRPSDAERVLLARCRPEWNIAAVLAARAGTEIMFGSIEVSVATATRPMFRTRALSARDEAPGLSRLISRATPTGRQATAIHRAPSWADAGRTPARPAGRTLSLSSPIAPALSSPRRPMFGRAQVRPSSTRVTATGLRPSRVPHGKQDAHRCIPPGRDPGGGATR